MYSGTYFSFWVQLKAIGYGDFFEIKVVIYAFLNQKGEKR